MKIVTIVRTLNEEENIGTFLERYGFSDHIIVSDGGSADETTTICDLNEKVILFENFPDRIVMHPEVPYMKYTNEPKQINFLIEEAMKLKPDWIIYDDADCYPNELLRDGAREILSSCEEGVVEAFRLYIYGRDRYFPELNKPGPSLWAWNPKKVLIRCDEKGDPREQNMRILTEQYKVKKIEPPHVLLHYYATSESSIKESLYWYALKDQPKRHPLFGGGRLEPLPYYAK